MLYNDYTTNLLGLKDILITSVKEYYTHLNICIQSTLKPPLCPCCSLNTRIHSYRMQNVKDLKIRDKIVILILKKKRWKCDHCGKSFYEKVAFLPRYYRMTQRVYEHIIKALKQNHSMKSVARDLNISSTTVARVFDIVCYSAFKLPQVLSIDEFKGNAGYEKYQFIIANPADKKVVDILPSRQKTNIIDYFKRFSDRKDVKFLIMDMWKPYKDIAWLFPNAKVIVDKYHYIRQVYWALDRVRKRVQKHFETSKRVYFKHSKRLLFASYEKLSDENKDALRVMLAQHEDLHSAWQLKEMFTDFRNCNDSTIGRATLKNWILTAQDSGLSEFREPTTAFLNWFEYILNSLDYPYTNGFIEGTNNKIKVIKRNAYGYRNFERFRNRILHCCA